MDGDEQADRVDLAQRCELLYWHLGRCPGRSGCLQCGAAGLRLHRVCAWNLPRLAPAQLRELHSLIHFGFVGPALANTAGTGPWTEGDAFSGVQSGDYRSSTSRPDLQESAWLVILAMAARTCCPMKAPALCGRSEGTLGEVRHFQAKQLSWPRGRAFFTPVLLLIYRAMVVCRVIARDHRSLEKNVRERATR